MMKYKIINKIINDEGGYVNDPKDSGGETNFGITRKTATECGYSGKMIDLPKTLAYEIYEKEYWKKMRLDELEPYLKEKTVLSVMTAAVNTGVYRASIFIQRSLNLLNNCEKHYSDVKTDGIVGEKTINNLKKLIVLRGDKGKTVFHRVFSAYQKKFYIELAEKRKKDEKFIYGWFLNRIF